MPDLRCDRCGKWTAPDDLIGTGNEYGDWTECVRCTSDSELERVGKTRK